MSIFKINLIRRNIPVEEKNKKLNKGDVIVGETMQPFIVEFLITSGTDWKNPMIYGCYLTNIGNNAREYWSEGDYSVLVTNGY